MRRTIVWISMLAFCLTLVVPAVAQDDMPGPPKVLQIIREEVKPGKAMMHEQHEAAWTQAFLKAKYDTHMLAISSVTGPTEDWFLVGFESFAAMEKDGEKFQQTGRTVNATFLPKEADYLNESRTMTARFRPDYSYKPNVNVGEYKYFAVNIVRFRLGEDVDAYYKAINEARQKAGLDSHIAVYAVNSGGPVSTVISFTPLKSMAQWDDPPNEAMQQALKDINWSQMVAKYIMSVDSRLFAMSPQMSNPTKEMVAANPSFWKPKPVMAKKSETTREVMPAAKKDTKTDKN